MKKIIKKISIYLCLMVSLLTINFSKVKADMGAPEIHEYEVVISNTEGTSLYNYNNNVILTIPYDTKLTVEFEYESDGKMYGTVTYNNKSGIIDLSDTKITTTEVNLEDFSKTESVTKLYVFRSGCYLFSGPSKNYEKVQEEEIPVGTTLEYEYYDDVWAYVEYDGQKGWIMNYPYSEIYSDLETAVATVASKNSKVLTVTKISELYKEPSGNSEKVSVSIPAWEEIDYKYVYKQAKSSYIYIEYDDTKGWLYIAPSQYGEDTTNAATRTNCGYILTLKDLTLYSKVSDKSSTTDKKLSANTEYAYKYTVTKDKTTWFQVTYKNKDYWVYTDEDYENDNIDFITSSTTTTYKTKSTLELYESPSKSSKKLTSTIAKDTTIESKFSEYIDRVEWVYIEYNDLKGWAQSTSLDYQSYSYVCDVATDEDEPEDDTKKSQKDDEDEDETTDDTDSLPLGLILGLAIGGAGILCLVAVVTIILINKKRSRQK